MRAGRRCVIIFTGGPGGGKTALIDELSHDPAWAGRFAALPEAIFTLRHVGIPLREKLFQRVMVCMQMAMEDALDRALGSDDPRSIFCHRGSLDPLAYWLDQSWPEKEFFEFTGISREDHYRRYAAVIHLVTAADGAHEHYTSWPDGHRSEHFVDAIRLDRLLHQIWHDHPNYHRISNDGIDWPTKSRTARAIL
jgi:hypothetical protein